MHFERHFAVYVGSGNPKHRYFFLFGLMQNKGMTSTVQRGFRVSRISSMYLFIFLFHR